MEAQRRAFYLELLEGSVRRNQGLSAPAIEKRSANLANVVLGHLPPSALDEVRLHGLDTAAERRARERSAAEHAIVRLRIAQKY